MSERERERDVRTRLDDEAKVNDACWQMIYGPVQNCGAFDVRCVKWTRTRDGEWKKEVNERKTLHSPKTLWLKWHNLP